MATLIMLAAATLLIQLAVEGSASSRQEIMLQHPKMTRSHHRARPRTHIHVASDGRALLKLKPSFHTPTSRCAARCVKDASTACISSCEASLQRLQRAAASVLVADARKISFPRIQSLRAKFGRVFDGMMFAGGARTGGGDNSFVARICTNNCDKGASSLVSKVVVGQLNNPQRDAPLTWKEPSVLTIPHGNIGRYVGPEDPRLDVVNGSRFVLANVNVQIKECPSHRNQEWKDPRHMFFSPVDAIPDAQPCEIQVDEVSPCTVQKNWSPLVPLRSSEIYYVYSLSPFKVLHFDKRACRASFISKTMGIDLSASSAGLENVHGGTRFIHGMTVPGGDVYFAFAHSAAPDYHQLLVAVLLEYPHGHDGEPSFHLIGTSCPIAFMKSSPSDDMLITTSLVNFDPAVDLAEVTFQKYDSQNYHTEVRGIGSWLDKAYNEFHNFGPSHCANAESA